MLSTVPPATYQWQGVNLPSVPLAADEASGGTGGTVTYTATVTVANNPTATQLDVTLPPTFAYVAGSAAIDGAAWPIPASGAPSGWTTQTLPVGTHTLTFQAAAGIGLGPASATVTAAMAGAVVSSSSAVRRRHRR